MRHRNGTAERQGMTTHRTPLQQPNLIKQSKKHTQKSTFIQLFDQIQA